MTLPGTIVSLLLTNLKSLIYFGVIAGAIWFAIHYTNLREENQRLASNNAALIQALEEEKATLDKVRQNERDNQTRVAQLQARNLTLQQEVSGYLEIFRRHDLAALARARPGLIEPRINSGTSEVFRSIENETARAAISSTND